MKFRHLFSRADRWQQCNVMEFALQLNETKKGGNSRTIH